MKNSVGRFISQDPVFWELNQNLANPQSLNSYSYANNNPVTFSDPDGRCVDGITTIVCIGAWFALSSIFVGSAAIIVGGIQDNPDAIEGGLGMMGVGTAIGGGLAVSVNQPSPQVVTQTPNMKGGPYSVYEGRDGNGDLRYAGITKQDPQARFNQHGRATGSGREDLDYSPRYSNFSEYGAHKMEQSYIDKYGMQKNGGQLLNKVNSISPSYQIGGSGASNANMISQLQGIINGLLGLIGQMQSAPAPAGNNSKSKSK